MQSYTCLGRPQHGLQRGRSNTAQRQQQQNHHNVLASPRPHHQQQRVQAASTQTVTKDVQAQPQAGAWSPWKVLNPFGRKQQQETLATISADELMELLAAEQQVPLVVIFSATWCGPCKIMVQRLESLMKTLGPQGIRAVKIDTDACPDLASELKVYKLPTLFFVGTNGASKPAAHYTGLLPEHVMRDMVETRSQFLGTDIHKALNI